ncbi:CarD family transcriptional regulator [Rhodopseudomonas boonkerdii]|nr:CarD family transcriptional regulator [Rhodopseudomonas boonkerdii]
MSSKRSASKGHARPPVKDTRTTTRTTAKVPPAKASPVKASTAKVPAAKIAAGKPSAAKTVIGKTSGAKTSGAKAAAPKSAQNKRNEMPNKTAKPATEKPAVKAAAPKNAAAKPAAAKPSTEKTAVKLAAKPVTEKVHVEKASIEKSAAPKTTASAMKAAAAKEQAKAAAAEKPVAAKPVAPAPRVEEPKKAATQRQGFKTNEYVVYPAHGVGQIMAIDEQEIAGAKLELFVINFMKDKMTLRVPTAKVANVGMRKLSEPALVKKALETLKGRARIKRTMWSRRAQEYEAKINSGDIVAIAEVVRDLFRSESQPEQSYSERQLYEAALDRLSREIAVVQHVTETEAVKEIEGQLAKSPRRGAKAEDAEANADDADEGDEDVAEDEAA